GPALRGQVAHLAGAVAGGVAADAVGALAAGALAERRAGVAEQRLALLARIAREVAGTCVVRRARHYVGARAGRPGHVAGLAGAVALRGGLRAAHAVDAVARLAVGRRRRRAARAVVARGRVRDVLPELARPVGRVVVDRAAEQVRRPAHRVERHHV